MRIRVLRRLPIAIAALVIATACVPTGPTTTVDPRLKRLAVEMQAFLDDPAKVASLGRDQAERDEAVAAIRKFIADPAKGVDVGLLDSRIAEYTAKAAARSEQQQASSKDAAAAAAAARETEVASAMKGAPSHDEVIAAGSDQPVDDAGETAESMAAKEGAAEMGATYATRKAQVLDRLRTGNVEGDPLAEHLRGMGYGENGTIESQGPCDARTGTRSAPDPNTRPGTIYTPRQDTFAGLSTSGRPTYTGELRTRTFNGQEQFLVEGHLMDTAIVDSVIGGQVAQASIDEFFLHIFLQMPGVSGPVEMWGSGNTSTSVYQFRFLCYAEDADLQPGDRITRGYFEAWINTTGNQYSIAEPGFQVRSAVSDNYWSWFGDPYIYYFGGDQKTVHIGPEPLAHHDPAPSTIGVRLDDGFLVDDNQQTDDDIEALARGPITNAINNAISTNVHPDGWLDPSSPPYLPVYYNVLSATPHTTNVDLSLLQAVPTQFNPDDEYWLKAEVELVGVELGGYANLIDDCPFTMKADATLEVTAAIDVSGTSPTALAPRLEIRVPSLSIYDQSWPWYSVTCNFGWLAGSAIAERAIRAQVEEALQDLPDRFDNLISQRADIADYVNRSLTFGNYGNGIQTAFTEFDQTCQPYGCDAGDVAIVQTGLEMSGDLLVTDQKGPLDRRRFNVSYQPTTATPVSSLIRDEHTPDGDPYSAGAFIGAATLNQLLRSVTEGGGLNRGVFDTKMADGAPFNMHPEVAPFFLSQSLSGKTLGVLLPDLRVDNGGYERLAVNLAVGLDVTYDEATGQLVPATVGVSDIAAGLEVYPVRCSSLLWSVCGFATQFVNGLANEIGLNLLPQLTHNTLGQISVPAIAGMPVISAGLENVDGNLAAYLRVGGPHLNVDATSTSNGNWTFTASPINFPETGTTSYHWVVTDDFDGSLIESAMSNSPTYTVNFGDVPLHAFATGTPTQVLPNQWQVACRKEWRPRVTTTATNGTVTATDDATGYWSQNYLATAPTQSQLAC